MKTTMRTRHINWGLEERWSRSLARVIGVGSADMNSRMRRAWKGISLVVGVGRLRRWTRSNCVGCTEHDKLPRHDVERVQRV